MSDFPMESGVWVMSTIFIESLQGLVPTIRVWHLLGVMPRLTCNYYDIPWEEGHTTRLYRRSQAMMCRMPNLEVREAERDDW